LPLYLSVWYRLFGAEQIVGRVAMLPVWLVFAYLMARIGRRLGGDRVAVAALAVFGLMPTFVWASVTTLSQLPSATLALAAAELLGQLRASNTRAADGRVAALLGVSVATLMLVRPSNMMLAVLVLGYLLVRQRRAPVIAYAVLAFALTLGAWTYKAHELTGRILVVNSANAQNVFYGNNPWTPLYRTWWFGSHKTRGEEGVPDSFVTVQEAIMTHPIGERDPLYRREAFDHMAARPDLFLIRTAARVRTFFAFDTFVAAQLAKRSPLQSKITLAADAALYVMIAGLALSVWAVLPRDAERRRTLWELLFVAFGYSIPYFLVFSHPTFHFTALPLVGIVAAYAALELHSRGVLASWRAMSGRARVGLAVAMAALLLIQVEWVVAGVERTRGNFGPPPGAQSWNQAASVAGPGLAT
jgi:4-amino-4-deoxy-L-arabinose transferase-like glycosyltransferase